MILDSEAARPVRPHTFGTGITFLAGFIQLLDTRMDFNDVQLKTVSELEIIEMVVLNRK